jgi:hypothetical protein
MRVGPLWLGFLVLLSWQSSLADAIRFRCVRAGPGPKEIMVVTLDPLLGQMKAESYASKTLSSQATFQIEAMDEAFIRGRNVGQGRNVGHRGTLVLELNRVGGRATVTVGDHEPTYYDCEAASSTL